MPKTPQITPKNIILSAPVKKMVILGFDDAQLLDITGPLQVFATVNDILGYQQTAYEISLVAKHKNIRTTSGLVLQALPFKNMDISIDTLLISGGKGINQLCHDKATLDWIEMAARSAKRVASVCSGAFALATIGLLDKKLATTHWNRLEEFRQAFPQVDIKGDAIFTKQDKIWTSAGITSGIDMALAMVEEDIGFDIAKKVAQQLVVFLRRPGGQAQFSTLMKLFSPDQRFNALNHWIMNNLQLKLDVFVLAEHAGMSERNFSRRYQQATGYPPAKAVEMIRIEAARNFLENHMGIKQTARKCGFNSEETLRRAFHKLIGISPQAYRERFSQK